MLFLSDSEIIFDPSYLVIYETDFESESWKDTLYGDGPGVIPTNIPNSRGYGLIICAYVDFDHTGDVITRRSRFGCIIFLNKTPVYWILKKQGGIGTNSFGSDFIALEACWNIYADLDMKFE